MPNSDSIREAIERFTQQERKLLSELNEVRITLKTLKRTAGIEVGSEETEVQEQVTPAITEPLTNGSVSPIPGLRPNVRPDEFFGATHAEAARRYLKKVGSAVSFDELVEVLRKGGCKLTGADPKKILYISLIRNSKDFVPPQPGYVGLREFYPARAKSVSEQRVKRARPSAKKKQSQKPVAKPKQAEKANSKPKAKETPGKKATEVVSPEPSEQPVQQPKRVPLAVHEFMGDKQFHALDEVIDAVREKLGDSAALKISVRGALSSKKAFEQNLEGMYRLVN